MKLFEMLFGKPVSTISAPELNDRLRNGKRALVIDVRQPDEYRIGHIAGAKLIPLNKLSNRMKDLPRTGKLSVFVHRETEVVQRRGYLPRQA